MRPTRGFTLIELLVVIAIIGLLSSVVLVSLNTARDKAADAKRASDLKAMQLALELYYSTNGSYPSVSNWTSHCVFPNWTNGTYDIPGLVPTYIGLLPRDPQTDNVTQGCYVYYSNGIDYKFTAHHHPRAKYDGNRGLIDPRRDNGPDYNVVDGASGAWAWAVYTPGGSAW